MKKNLSAICFLFAAATSASAAINDLGTYFQDTDTGLYWLKLTETAGYSYDDISDNLNPTGDFPGWRRATVAEVDTMIGNYGIPAPGVTCTPPYNAGAYCYTVNSAYAETLEDLIKFLGDFVDVALDELNDELDIAPDGAGGTYGIIGEKGDVPGSLYWQHVWRMQILDRQYVNRATGAPQGDYQDQISTKSVQLIGSGSSTVGTFLVSDTDPAVPPIPQDPLADNVILFDYLTPEQLGLTVLCDSYVGGPTFCYWDDEIWYETPVPDYSGTLTNVPFTLAVTPQFDAQARPWIRMTGYDYRNGGSVTCDGTDTYLGDEWCRREIDTSAPWTYLPPEPGLTSIYGSGDYIDGTFIFVDQVDNVHLEFLSDNVTIDFDPWNAANVIRPKASYLFPVLIQSTSIAGGDLYDFNAADVDSATVTVGPGMAPVATVPQIQDFDGDGDIDVSVGFDMQTSGIGCLDTTISISGRTLAGDPFVGHDTIVPMDCEEIIEIDIDPFNAGDEVRPEDDYVVPVGVLGLNTTDGDAIDLDATQVDPASLRFGPSEAANTLSPLIVDFDGDSNDDLIVGFDMLDTGITCGDTDAELTGSLYSGLPIEGVGTLTTTDCQTTQCHP